MNKSRRTRPLPAALSPAISDAEITTILADAQANGDRFTVASAKRALKGDTTERIACVMILGR